MDPLTQYLSPFLPLAFLAVTIVALIRESITTTDPKTKEKKMIIDGRARVLPLVALISFGVVVWSQLHANPSAALNWLRIASEVPAVFFLSAGGATFIQRLKDRGQSLLLEDTTALEEAAGHTKEGTGFTRAPESGYVFGLRDERDGTSSPIVGPSKALPDGSMEIPVKVDVVAEHPGALLTGVMDEPTDKAKDTPDEIVKP